MTRRNGRRNDRRSEGHPRRSSKRRDESHDPNRSSNNNNQINSENNYNIDDEFVREKDPNEYNYRYDDDSDNEIDPRNNNNTEFKDIEDDNRNNDETTIPFTKTEMGKEQIHSNNKTRERRSRSGRRKRAGSGSVLDPSERSQETPIATIYVRNFKMGTTVAQLSETFTKYGELSHIILLPPPPAGTQCYAYVAFKRVRYMEYALAEGTSGYISPSYTIDGRPLIVEKAKSVPRSVRHSAGVKVLWENYIKREREMSKDNKRNKSRRRNGDLSIRNSRNTGNDNDSINENNNNNNDNNHIDNDNNDTIKEFGERELVNSKEDFVGSRKRKRSLIEFDDEEEHDKYADNNDNNGIKESQEDQINIDPFTFYYSEKVQSSRTLLRSLSNGKNTKTCNILNQLESHSHNNHNTKKNSRSKNSRKRNSSLHLQTDYYNSDDDHFSDKKSQLETSRSKSIPYTPHTPHTPNTPHTPHNSYRTAERLKCICGRSYFDDSDTDGSDTDSLIRSFKRFKQRRITARQEKELRKLNSILPKNSEDLESLGPPLGPPSYPPPDDDEYEIISDGEETKINEKNNIPVSAVSEIQHETPKIEPRPSNENAINEDDSDYIDLYNEDEDDHQYNATNNSNNKEIKKNKKLIEIKEKSNLLKSNDFSSDNDSDIPLRELHTVRKFKNAMKSSTSTTATTTSKITDSKSSSLTTELSDSSSLSPLEDMTPDRVLEKITENFDEQELEENKLLEKQTPNKNSIITTKTDVKTSQDTLVHKENDNLNVDNESGYNSNHTSPSEYYHSRPSSPFSSSISSIEFEDNLPFDADLVIDGSQLYKEGIDIFDDISDDIIDLTSNQIANEIDSM